MYALASAKFGSRAATVIPLVSAIGNMGGLIGPTMIGGLANDYGLRTILWLIPVLGAVFVAIVFAWEIADTSGDCSRRIGLVDKRAGPIYNSCNVID